jgi:hypothetical protein
MPRPLLAWSFPVCLIMSCISLLSKCCRFSVNISVEQSPWEASSSSSNQKLPAFVETQGSVPCSRGSATFRYLEPDQPSPRHPIPLLRFNLLLSHRRTCLYSGLFSSHFRIQILCAFFFFPIHAICLAHLIFHVFKNCNSESAVIHTPL